MTRDGTTLKRMPLSPSGREGENKGADAAWIMRAGDSRLDRDGRSRETRTAVLPTLMRFFFKVCCPRVFLVGSSRV